MTPDARLRAWQSLADPRNAGLLRALHGIDAAPAPAAMERLRTAHGTDEVAAGIELSIARTRAHAKFGDAADSLWADRAGVEMASAPAVAAWKAARFRTAGAQRIDDLCSGIGGDLMELARVAPTTGADLDPVRAWMASRNAGCDVRVADAVVAPGDAAFAHADPARRDRGGARRWAPEDLEPPFDAVRGAMRARAGWAMKLGPGMDLGPEHVTGDEEVEFIGDRSGLVQQVLWAGALAVQAGMRTATRVDLGITLNGVPAAPEAGAGRAGRVLLVPDAALERARLLAGAAVRLQAAELAAGLGILTTDRAPGRDSPDAPWFECFEVLEELPAREATVARWLAARGAGIVTIRTRGGACDPDRWQRALRGPGDEPHVVFVLRVGERRCAYAVRRIEG
jgi:hypothetical protein